MNSYKIVDLEYHPHSEEQEISESDEMGISKVVDVNIAILIVKLAFLLAAIGIGEAILRPLLQQLLR